MTTGTRVAKVVHAAARRRLASGRRRLRRLVIPSGAGDPGGRADHTQGVTAAAATVGEHGAKLAYDPELVPSLKQMRLEGIDVLEEWFRWGEEWSVILRVFGGLGADTDVLEIGCGQGRIAFPLRFVMWGDGSYMGFDIDREKVAFLVERFQRAYPRFRFSHRDVRNTFYNPEGTLAPEDFTFPYLDNEFDLVFAASVFTHMAPDAVARYFHESARVLRPGGRCVFSFFLLDMFDPDRRRPEDFGLDLFDFVHHHPAWGEDVAITEPDNPEQMTAYRLSLVRRMAEDAGLRFARDPVPGMWSGATRTWIGAQELIVLEVEPRSDST